MCHAPTAGRCLLFQFRAATRSAACWGSAGWRAASTQCGCCCRLTPSRVECESGSCKTWRRPLRYYQGQVQLQIKIKIIIIMPGTCPKQKTKGKSLLTIENLTLFTSIFHLWLLNYLKIVFTGGERQVAGVYSQPWEWAEDQPLWKS